MNGAPLEPRYFLRRMTGGDRACRRGLPGQQREQRGCARRM